MSRCHGALVFRYFWKGVGAHLFSCALSSKNSGFATSCSNSGHTSFHVWRASAKAGAAFAVCFGCLRVHMIPLRLGCKASCCRSAAGVKTLAFRLCVPRQDHLARARPSSSCPCPCGRTSFVCGPVMRIAATCCHATAWWWVRCVLWWPRHPCPCLCPTVLPTYSFLFSYMPYTSPFSGVCVVIATCLSRPNTSFRRTLLLVWNRAVSSVHKHSAQTCPHHSSLGPLRW